VLPKYALALVRDCLLRRYVCGALSSFVGANIGDEGGRVARFDVAVLGVAAVAGLHAGEAGAGQAGLLVED
jgi:hypothetical protein